MKKNFWSPALAAALLCALVLTSTAATLADDYNVDPMHSSVTFRIAHLGLTYIHGRFNEVAGTFTVDKDLPARTTFALAIRADSVDTSVKKRDDHLRSPDFFNAKQFPDITFKSTAVKPIDNGYDVTGDFTMHGVTKPVTIKLLGGRTAEFPKGVQRTGYYSDFKIKRSDFGVGDDKFGKALSDDVYISVSFEGTKK